MYFLEEYLHDTLPPEAVDWAMGEKLPPAVEGLGARSVERWTEMARSRGHAAPRLTRRRLPPSSTKSLGSPSQWTTPQWIVARLPGLPHPHHSHLLAIAPHGDRCFAVPPAQGHVARHVPLNRRPGGDRPRRDRVTACAHLEHLVWRARKALGARLQPIPSRSRGGMSGALRRGGRRDGLGQHAPAARPGSINGGGGARLRRSGRPAGAPGQAGLAGRSRTRRLPRSGSWRRQARLQSGVPATSTTRPTRPLR